MNKKSATILLIDDEPIQLQTLSGFLKRLGYRVETADSGTAGVKKAQAMAVDLVLTDFKMPDKNGLEVLREVKAINPEIDVVIMTAYGSIDSATGAMKAGAIDYLSKPIDLDQLEIILKKAIERRRLISENRRLREQLASRHRFSEIISQSPQMENVLNRAARVAPSNATVLIRGESGTGKELVARAIHAGSSRMDGPFVAVNCAAITETLLESELFGHGKGAFTSALNRKKGRFEIADTGTLFLDEVGDIPPTIQVKLLRALQEKAFERVGGTETLAVDVRIIAATNRYLEKMLEDGSFREDLYYRLNVVSLLIPPLRERRTDITRLTDHFLRKYAAENSRPEIAISKEAFDALIRYDFPGNVRELENIIEQAVVLARENLITTDDLPVVVRSTKSELDTSAGSFDERVAAFEKNLILEALAATGGVQTQAAEKLGMTERHLRYKLKKYGLK
ncbi:MAG: sigma-54-dependent transcriptional regulator [bacterium]